MDKQSAFKAALRLMQLGEVPNVIFTTSTQIAEGVIEASKFFDLGSLKTPTIISLSEDSWTSSSYPNIIKLPRKAMHLGEQAAEILLGNINHSAFYESKNILMENPWADRPGTNKTKMVTSNIGSKNTLRVLMLDSSSSYATYSLMPDFKKNFGANVQIDTLSYNELYDAIKDEKQSASYDVFQLDIPWMPEFVERNLLVNISSYIKEDQRSIDGLIPGILDSYAKYNDSFYGMPYMYGTQLLFYRKDYFEDIKLQRLFYEQYKSELNPPKTWAEFNAVAKFFTNAYNDQSPTEYGTTLGGRFSSGAVCEYLPRMWAYGGMVFDKDGKVIINSKESLKALNNYCESFLYASKNSSEHWWNEQVTEFIEGKAAMMVLFMSHATDISDRAKSKVVGKVGYDIVPGGAPLLGGWSLGINRNCSDKKLAFKFISWASSKDLAIPQTILGGSTPCINLYNSSELCAVYPWLPKALESFSISRKRTVPRSVGGLVLSERQYEEILGEAIHNSVIKAISPEAAIISAAKSLQELKNMQNNITSKGEFH
jgi:ABC-type glycerol-3-phosphate transport system substrate-binding protein